MYVERGTKELVCAKKGMRLCEEEEREFDESLSLCLRLREGESFFFFLIRFRFWGRKGFYFYFYFQIIDVKNYESLKSYMASSQEVKKKKKVKGFGFIVYIN